jgi:hypothetical protein
VIARVGTEAANAVCTARITWDDHEGPCSTVANTDIRRSGDRRYGRDSSQARGRSGCAQSGNLIDSIHLERALALMFDIAPQNGSIDEVVEAQIERDFAMLDAGQPTDAVEVARLQVVANRRAPGSNPAYVNDVRIRK